MTFLPIVERELQVSARRRVTYWLRSGAALLATALAVWIFETSRAVTGAAAGGQLFGMLSTFAWAACLVTGIFLTADCLSEEKRSGTLGLLFLTDLRPADIILGKLTEIFCFEIYFSFFLFCKPLKKGFKGRNYCCCV